MKASFLLTCILLLSLVNPSFAAFRIKSAQSNLQLPAAVAPAESQLPVAGRVQVRHQKLLKRLSLFGDKNKDGHTGSNNHNGWPGIASASCVPLGYLLIIISMMAGSLAIVIPGLAVLLAGTIFAYMGLSPKRSMHGLALFGLIFCHIIPVICVLPWLLILAVGL